VTDGRTPDGDAARVFYDGECAMCAALAARWTEPLRARGIELVPLQAPGTGELLGVGPHELRSRMWMLTRDGAVLGGADAWVRLTACARWPWWARPLVAASRLPGGMPVIRWAYGWVAAHRHCLGGACAPDHRNRPAGP